MDREIAQLVTTARERLAKLPDINTDAGYGDAAEELARYGAAVDLLVLGAHNSARSTGCGVAAPRSG